MKKLVPTALGDSINEKEKILGRLSFGLLSAAEVQGEMRNLVGNME